jgi:hypothetical protein
LPIALVPAIFSPRAPYPNPLPSPPPPPPLACSPPPRRCALPPCSPPPSPPLHLSSTAQRTATSLPTGAARPVPRDPDADPVRPRCHAEERIRPRRPRIGWAGAAVPTSAADIISQLVKTNSRRAFLVDTLVGLWSNNGKSRHGHSSCIQHEHFVSQKAIMVLVVIKLSHFHHFQET